MMSSLFTREDEQYMQLALDLAEKGLYTTTPNPRVGCVIVKEGRVIGSGFHSRTGLAHAEVMALSSATEDTEGATVYVTLEPCCHTGLTPPCVSALLKARVGKVVAAMKDPNPQVAGKGLIALKNAGVDVEYGLLEEAASKLNLGFIQRMQVNKPWVRLKIAASLDGKTALFSGESRWITSIEAREDVQKLRARSCAVLTGIGTILADDARLTVRSFDIGRQPLRVILDSQLRIPLDAGILDTTPLLIITLHDQPEKHAALQQKGVEVIVFDGPKIELSQVLTLLSERGCNEVLIEAGMRLNGAFLREKLVDEIVLYQAPILLGASARDMIDMDIESLDDKIVAYKRDIVAIGQDLRWTLQLTQVDLPSSH